MHARGLLKFAIVPVLCCATILPQTAGAGSTDGFFIESGSADARSGQEVAPYDSEYAAAAREIGKASNTPESDARPGEYYFLEAARAFHKKEYVFAIQMYEVAASWAFKPAEYNLGVMYARGQGVPIDLPRAMAWMALAAERNEQHYVDAREAVYAAMTKEQFEQANAIWRELKKTYGDEVALRRAKARWAEVRSHVTGSRVGSVGTLTVGMPEPNGGDPSNQKNQKAGANVHTTAATSAEITGGQGVDGSIAYRQLRASDNPYDPKFTPSALGKATVGPLEPVEPDPRKKKSADQADDHGEDADKHQR